MELVIWQKRKPQHFELQIEALRNSATAFTRILPELSLGVFFLFFFCEVQNLLEFVHSSVEIPNVWHGGGDQAAVSFCRFLLAAVSFGFLSQTG